MTDGEGSEPVVASAKDASPDTTEGVPQTQSVGTAASRGFLWANVGVFTRYASALVLAAVLARALNATDYAVMVTLMIVTFYFDNALDLGMGAALIYEQEDGVTERVQVAFTANVLVTGVLAVLAFFVAPLITRYYHLAGYDNVFRLLTLVVILSGLTTIPWALLMRGMDFRARAAVEVSRDLTRFFVTIGLVALGFDVWGVISGLVAAYFVWFALTWLFIKFKPVLHWDTAIVKELFAYAWRMAGTRFLGVLALNGDYLVVGNRRRDEYPLYYQAFRLPEFIMGAQLNAMSAVLFPMYSRIRSEGKVPMSQALYKALRLVALFSIPTGIGLALVSRDAIWIMYGTHNHVAVRTMELLSLAGCVVGIGFASGDLLFALGRPGVMVRINGAMVPIMLTAMWFVSPHGIIWVATVHLATGVVFQIIRQLVVNRIVAASGREVLLSLLPGVTISAMILLFALPVRLLTSSSLLSLIAIFVAGCVGAMVGLGISPTSRSEIRDVVTKVRG
ncbi:MAG TPA: oligosaccharide flippase family protein [Microthrixaceae bacterium]|nr:oligosaccharide flippase family protein [Microthrixaceae bacterium]